METKLAKVLVVDDELNQRTALAGLISAWGYDVQKASDGWTAMAALKTFEADIVITDLHMPGLDGKGLLEDAQEGAWGPYVNTVNANAFLLQQYTSGDAAKSMSWALDCEYTRQTYTNEVKCDDASKSIKLDGNLLKSFQSGGDVLSGGSDGSVRAWQ